jgi:hypothetical protein
MIHRTRLYLPINVLLVTILFISEIVIIVVVESCNHHGHDHNQNDDTSTSSQQKRRRQSIISNDTNNNVSSSIHSCLPIIPSGSEKEKDAEAMKQWKQSRLESFRNVDTTYITRPPDPSVLYYKIPVVFHLIVESLEQFIIRETEADLLGFVDFLNDEFLANTEEEKLFDFVLDFSKSTFQINKTIASNCYDNNNLLNYKEDLRIRVGTGETLNVYICNRIINKDIEFAGYAYFPSSETKKFVKDGISLARLATFEIFEVYNTFVHEVGHWLGLYHTYEGDSCLTTNTGDFVEDTPIHLFRPDKVKNCYTPLINPDTCPFVPGEDPVTNFMTYSDDSLCQSTFTEGQIERMIGQFELFRLVPSINTVRKLTASPRPVPRPLTRPLTPPLPRPVPPIMMKPTRKPTSKPTMKPTRKPRYPTRKPTTKPMTPKPKKPNKTRQMI